MAKKTRRERADYPALEKKYNLKLRQDYMETDYINGVYDKKGNEVIRPLTIEERKWLNQFYQETVNANFTHDKKIRKAARKLSALRKLEEPDPKEVAALEKYIRDRKKKVNLYSDPEDERKIYTENNARNRCILNRKKSIGILDALDDSSYVPYHETVVKYKDEIAEAQAIELDKILRNGSVYTDSSSDNS